MALSSYKMRRRWIMVELGEHCHTHMIPRLTKVIDGADKGGITGAAGWEGGGGFQYFRLAPSPLETDRYGRDIISKTHNAEMLAEALCKLKASPMRRVMRSIGSTALRPNETSSM